jgi:hypothetical protein
VILPTDVPQVFTILSNCYKRKWREKYNPVIMLLTGNFPFSAGNNSLCRQCACLVSTLRSFCPIRGTSGKYQWTMWSV